MSDFSRQVKNWRDENSVCSYPFTGLYPLQSVDGKSIPSAVFLDAKINVIASRSRFPSLTQIERTASSVVFVVSDGSTSYRGTWDFASNSEEIELRDTRGIYAGLLICDPDMMLTFLSWPLGTHAMKVNEFCLSCFSLLRNDSLSSLVVSTSAGDVSLYGDVCLTGGDGVIFEKIGNVIAVHVVGVPLWKRASEDPETFFTPRFVQAVAFESGTLFPASYETVCEVWAGECDGIVQIEALGLEVYEDVLKINGNDTTLRFSLAGQ